VLSFIRGLQKMLESPIKIAVIGLGLAFGSLLFQGTLLELWNLKSEKWRLQKRYQELTQINGDLSYKIDLARNSDKFIGRQAREKLDLIKDDELIFIFENDSASETPIASH
jgi:cell division protein FtsB